MNKDIKDFFEKLGYEVDWDFKRSGFNTSKSGVWWEISKGGKRICQIDGHVSLGAMVEDMSAFADGKPGTSNEDWICSGPPSPEMDELFRKVSMTLLEQQFKDGKGLSLEQATFLIKNLINERDAAMINFRTTNSVCVAQDRLIKELKATIDEQTQALSALQEAIKKSVDERMPSLVGPS